MTPNEKHMITLCALFVPSLFALGMGPSSQMSLIKRCLGFYGITILTITRQELLDNHMHDHMRCQSTKYRITLGPHCIRFFCRCRFYHSRQRNSLAASCIFLKGCSSLR
eukprot:Seg652.1 transcript_id=Seg652.1/GoldUCD/mRNA.D3Y31 product="hypothetical protein" protein_id=Seg652.1/GoldUCD/D3Y31